MVETELYFNYPSNQVNYKITQIIVHHSNQKYKKVDLILTHLSMPLKIWLPPNSPHKTMKRSHSKWSYCYVKQKCNFFL